MPARTIWEALLRVMPCERLSAMLKDVDELLTLLLLLVRAAHNSPGINAKAPAERLPVPAGGRSVTCAPRSGVGCT